MEIKIALAGNPNCGKTTLFNALTGANQYVGNWPGVTVEKKEGRLKGHKDVVIQDLPGIYSLSPYTLEEVVSRTYLVKEKPDAILNIVDGTNIERNLYLTTQLIELGLPVVVAVNMMDLVRKNGDEIDAKKLGEALGCQVVEISALRGEGGQEAAKLAVSAALAKRVKAGPSPEESPMSSFKQFREEQGFPMKTVTVKLKDGRTFTEKMDCHPGHPDNMMTREQFVDRFRIQAAPALHVGLNCLLLPKLELPSVLNDALSTMLLRR